MMKDKKSKIFCKICFLLVCVMLMGALITACGDDNEGPKNDATEKAENTSVSTQSVSESTLEAATAVPTAEPTPEPTPVPTAEPTPVPTEEPVNYPVEGPYIDVSKIKRIYVYPGESSVADNGLVNSANGWKSSDESVATVSSSEGKLVVKGNKTGLSKLTNSTTGETVLAYVIERAAQTDENKKIDGINYFLYYEKGSHTLTVYALDKDGYYTIPVRTINAACGSVPSKTPTGVHYLSGSESGRQRWLSFGKYIQAQYGISYKSGVWLHSTCYSEFRENSVLSHYYNTIGENSTGGCIRMQVGEIKWIWENCPGGTALQIVNGNPRGTTSEAPADISDSAMFDPTDPAYLDYLYRAGYLKK